jgi:hypothetical protein
VSFRIDHSDLDKLAADLDRVAREVIPEAKKTVGFGANSIKKDWRKRWRGLSHAPALPYAISYDVKQRGSTIEGEIGPDKSKPQGALGNLIEFGSINNAPQPGGQPALDTEEPKFVKFMENLGSKALEKL